MTTAVTLLSMQKYVPDRFAYCSENLRITSRFFDTTADPSSCEEDVVADSEDVVSARIFTENRDRDIEEERVLRHPDKSLEGDEDVLMEVGVRTTDMVREYRLYCLVGLRKVWELGKAARPSEAPGPRPGRRPTLASDDEAQKLEGGDPSLGEAHLGDLVSFSTAQIGPANQSYPNKFSQQILPTNTLD